MLVKNIWKKNPPKIVYTVETSGHCVYIYKNSICVNMENVEKLLHVEFPDPNQVPAIRNLPRQPRVRATTKPAARWGEIGEAADWGQADGELVHVEVRSGKLLKR
jgi:hypothetical protein